MRWMNCYALRVVIRAGDTDTKVCCISDLVELHVLLYQLHRLTVHAVTMAQEFGEGKEFMC
jgi:hypothetical protein